MAATAVVDCALVNIVAGVPVGCLRKALAARACDRVEADETAESALVLTGETVASVVWLTCAAVRARCVDAQSVGIAAAVDAGLALVDVFTVDTVGLEACIADAGVRTCQIFAGAVDAAAIVDEALIDVVASDPGSPESRLAGARVLEGYPG
jgi:hypothetical protein